MKRLPVKYIRDKAKRAYQKDNKCYICGTDQKLELHHYYALTDLFDIWCRKNKYKITTDEQILDLRDQFIEEHSKQIYEDVVTLCADHHMRLHSFFGKTPAISTAKAQAKWVEVQRGKHLE
jgi:hypothetical protein